MVSRSVAGDEDEPGAVAMSAIVREWTRIGCTGFGGPPAHIALLRALCVTERGWIAATDFEAGSASSCPAWS